MKHGVINPEHQKSQAKEAKMSELFEVKINNIPEKVDKYFDCESLVDLVKEYDVAAKENLIAVYIDCENQYREDHKIGCLESELSKRIIEKMDEDYIVEAFIENVNGRNNGNAPSITLSIEIQTKEEQAELIRDLIKSTASNKNGGFSKETLEKNTKRRSTMLAKLIERITNN